MTTQILTTRLGTDAAGSLWQSLTGGQDSSEVSNWGSRSLFSTPGVLSKLRVDMVAAPGGVKSYTYTVYLNANPTSLAVTITGAATTASDNDPAHAVSVTAGDYVHYKLTASGGPSNTNTGFATIQLVNANSGETNVFGEAGSVGGLQNVTAYLALWNAYSSSSVTDSLATKTRSLAPCAGTITSLWMVINSAPPAGQTHTYDIFLNGTSQGVSLQFTSASGTALNVATNIAVAAGDQLTLQAVGTATSGNKVVMYGTCFVPTVNGQSIMKGMQPVQPITSRWGYVNGGANPTTPENLAAAVCHATTLKSLYVALSVAPGAGTSWTYTVRKNGVDTALTVTISDTNTTGSIVIDVAVAEGDTIDISMTSSGAVAATVGVYAITQSNPLGSGDGGIARKLIAVGII